MGKIQEGINRETYMGTIPIVKGERLYSFTDITLSTAGFGIASWCYVQGAWISSTLNFTQSMIITFFPMIFFGLIMTLLVIIPARYGVDLWMYQRAVFGHNLVFVICLVALLVTLGWAAVNADVFGGAVINMGKLAGYDISAGQTAFALLCVIISYFTALRGPYVVKIATYIMVPCLIGVGVLLLIKIFSMTTLEELMSYEPMYADTYPNTKIAFLCMVEAMFAFVFAWYPVLGGLARITKTEKSAYWGTFLGYVLAMCFFVGIGVTSATLMSGRFGVYSTDPTDWLLQLAGGGWAAISILAIGLANVTTGILGVYCCAIVVKVFKPDWQYKWIALGICAIEAAFILWEGIWTYYNVYLAAVAIVGAVGSAIALSDFMVVRRGKFSLRACFRRGGHDEYVYTAGVNLVALVSFAIGVVCYIITYNPITYTVNNEALMLFTPTLLSFIGSGGSYALFCQIPAVKKYVVREEKGTFDGPLFD